MNGGRRPGGRSTDPSSARDEFDRGLSPVVGKTLELAVGVLFVSLLTATFFGGLVPEYRAAVGTELGDRALVGGAERVETAVPGGDHVEIERSVSVGLPETIRGDPYRIIAVNDSNGSALRLSHPDRSVSGRVRLALPPTTTVRGSWRSPTPSQVVVRGTDGTVTVRLVDGAKRAGSQSAPSEGST
ncbi:DUF7266 family protein [Halobellus ordinarius]|uniref:DUF7266 family protein n=1 Tax=Halobellus ordinarius TaxID=3075120 RepID=UPI0028803A3A|nr:hypothetical protein [Halobellus sp. ZY16]